HPLNRLIRGGPDQVLQHLLVVQPQHLVAERAGDHLHPSVDPDGHHAAAGGALRGQLPQALLELLHLLLDLGQLPEQAGELAEVLEEIHRQVSSPSPAGSAAVGAAPKPSSRWTTWAPRTSMARLSRGSCAASARWRR